VRTASYRKMLNHDPVTVSAFLTDLRNDASWRQEIVSVDLVSGHPGEVGAQYVESVAWEGVVAHATLTVTEAVAGSRLVVIASDPGYQSMYEYGFSPGNGGTELSLSMSIETLGPLSLIEPFMWAIVTRWVERDLDVLDEALSRATESTAQAEAGEES
jgi:hypothetical protein